MGRILLLLRCYFFHLNNNKNQLATNYYGTHFIAPALLANISNPFFSGNEHDKKQHESLRKQCFFADRYGPFSRSYTRLPFPEVECGN